MKKESVQKLTSFVLDAMQNPVQWKKLWSSVWPRNAIIGSRYNWMNKITLNYIRALNDYKENRWLTFKQVQAKGGTVIKWQKGIPIYFWKFFEGTDKDWEIKKIPMVKIYYVRNVEQVEWLELKDEKTFDTQNLPDVDNVINEYLTRENIKTELGEPAYRPATDTIFMPNISNFMGTDEFYLAYLHEITHSTGAEKRLNRWLNTTFASKDYSKEELVAEFGALLCYNELWKTLEENANSFNYLANWAKHIQKEWLEQELFNAISKAEKAKKFILDKEK